MKMVKGTKLHICEYIDSYMIENKITNTELAKALNYKTTSILRWRRKICSPDINELQKLCDFMNCTPEELTGLDYPEKRKGEEKELSAKIEKDYLFRKFCLDYLENDKVRALVNVYFKVLDSHKSKNNR